MLLNWITTHGHGCAARFSIARVQVSNDDDAGHGLNKEKPLRFDPWDGGLYFWFKNRLIFYHSELRDEGFRKEELLSITCLGRSPLVLKDLLAECRDEYLKKNKDKTTIFENHGDHWRKVKTRSIRPLSTVIFGREQQRLLDDMEVFLKPETHQWFTRRKMPYRKGYLFYGPPGTGKSSFSLSMAGEFNLDIYITHLASVDDKTLQHLFNSLPEKCIVLLEDIDAASTTRSPSIDVSGVESSSTQTKVSLSGLLNAIDGVASHEGRVLIMTTNHIEKLDEALIRPGRVDMKSEFGLADSDMAARLFRFVFEDDPHTRKTCQSRDLAFDFASKLPRSQFSSAQILSYLTLHRDSSIRALKDVNDWIKSSLEGHRTDWVNQNEESTPCNSSMDEGLWMKRVKNSMELQTVKTQTPPPSLDESSESGVSIEDPYSPRSPAYPVRSALKTSALTRQSEKRGRQRRKGNIDRVYKRCRPKHNLDESDSASSSPLLVMADSSGDVPGTTQDSVSFTEKEQEI